MGSLWRCARGNGVPAHAISHRGLQAAKPSEGHFWYYSFAPSPYFWEFICVAISALLNGGDKISIRCGRSSVQFYLEMISFSLALPYWVGLLLCSFGNQLIANALIPALGLSATGERPGA